MTIKERYRIAIAYFEEYQPIAETELVYDNPYELLVSVILSAQCTDKRVNMTTPAIFHRWPTPEKLSHATFDELFPYIKSISYPNNKTKHLIGMANMLMNDFSGQVPMTVEELIRLPGVGRKTANVITSVIDRQPNMAVDTHVFRVSARLGLTKNATTPLAAEKQLISPHTYRTGTQGPPLAYSARQVHLSCAKSQVPGMRPARYLPVLQKSGSAGAEHFN